MTFRVGCMVTCEDIPRAVKIPPASNATATNPIRRFIVSSSTQILMDCVKFPTARPRECNTQCFLRQARPRSSCRSTTKHILLDVIFRLRGFSGGEGLQDREAVGDRKSTRLNSSHGYISYAVFCLKNKRAT